MNEERRPSKKNVTYLHVRLYTHRNVMSIQLEIKLFKETIVLKTETYLLSIQIDTCMHVCVHKYEFVRARVHTHAYKYLAKFKSKI